MFTLNFLIDSFDLLCMFLMNQVNHLIVSHYTDRLYIIKPEPGLNFKEEEDELTPFFIQVTLKLKIKKLV